MFFATEAPWEWDDLYERVCGMTRREFVRDKFFLIIDLVSETEMWNLDAN